MHRQGRNKDLPCMVHLPLTFHYSRRLFSCLSMQTRRTGFTQAAVSFCLLISCISSQTADDMAGTAAPCEVRHDSRSELIVCWMVSVVAEHNWTIKSVLRGSLEVFFIYFKFYSVLLLNHILHIAFDLSIRVAKNTNISFSLFLGYINKYGQSFK